MTDRPEELATVAQDPAMGNILARVFGGAHLIAWDDAGLLAVWYGGTGFNVYNPNAWPHETGEVYHFNMPDHSQIDEPEAYARETLEDYGFHFRDPARAQFDA